MPNESPATSTSSTWKYREMYAYICILQKLYSSFYGELYRSSIAEEKLRGHPGC